MLLSCGAMGGPADRLDRYRELVGDWPALVEACSRPLPLVVWANPLRRAEAARLAGVPAGAEEEPLEVLFRERGLSHESLRWLDGAYRLDGLDKPGHTLEHYLGLFHVQEEVSLVPPEVLGARPGERVLDLCAAPGGKTARIAVHMDNRGTLIANDVRAARLRALRSNCERLGVLNVLVTPIDGTRFPVEAGGFDRILLDVPCSCEGNLRTTREAAGAAPPGVVAGRAGLQATLLGRAWKLLSPGGVLVYSTCTFAPEENEVVLDYALGEDARIEPCEMPGLVAEPGVERWNGEDLRPDCRHLLRFWPHLNDTGGFTVARVRKRAG